MKKSSLLVALGSVVALSSCVRVEQNEVGLRIGADGGIYKTVRGPDLVCVVPLCNIGARGVVFKTFTDTFSISSGSGAAAAADGKAETTQQRQIFIRTSDDKFVESVSFSIAYEINEKASDADIAKLYSVFRANSDSPDTNALSIRDDLQILVVDPLVKGMRSVEALEVQDKGAETGAAIAAGLQAAVNKRLGIAEGQESPIRIVSVMIGGVKFDEETEKVLRQKVLAAEQAEIAKVAGAAAEEQAKAAAAQSDVTGQVYRGLRGSVPEGQLSTAVCLDLKRQNRIPESTQCFPGLVVR